MLDLYDESDYLDRIATRDETWVRFCKRWNQGTIQTVDVPRQTKKLKHYNQQKTVIFVRFVANTKINKVGNAKSIMKYIPFHLYFLMYFFLFLFYFGKVFLLRGQLFKHLRRSLTMKKSLLKVVILFVHTLIVLNK